MDGEPIHVDLALDGYRIGIASVASSREHHGLDPAAAGQRAVVVLWTDDTPAAYSQLVAAGAPALSAPHVWLGRLLIAWVTDPDGNPVQIAQPLPAVTPEAPARDGSAATAGAGPLAGS